jgi:hypothetical protein
MSQLASRWWSGPGLLSDCCSASPLTCSRSRRSSSIRARMAAKSSAARGRAKCQYHKSSVIPMPAEGKVAYHGSKNLTCASLLVLPEGLLTQTIGLATGGPAVDGATLSVRCTPMSCSLLGISPGTAGRPACLAHILRPFGDYPAKVSPWNTQKN